MALWLAALLVLLCAVCGGTGDKWELAAQGCSQAQNMSVLGALPGGGWDNLRNVELGPVLWHNYSQCRTTHDGEYLIPDHVYVVPRRESVVETRAELMDQWLSYTDTWAASVNAEVSYLPMLNGKFSADFQNVKKHDLEHETVTTRVQVRHNIYSVKAPETPTLHPDFRQHLVTISDHLENNETREADYLAEMLVLRYGTHVLTHVDVGASLVQEDQVKRDLMSDKAVEKTSISLAASAVFFKVVNVGASGSWQEQSERFQSYVQSTVSSKTRSYGGSPFYPGITLQAWQDSIGKRLVAIGRSGLPLPTQIKPEALPELPEPAVHRVAAAVHAAISRYYAVNVHPGCLRRGSPDFNPQANVDDGSCDAGGRTDFGFGGVFQACEAVSGEDAESLCQNYHVANPLTGKASCPANYTATALHRELKTSTQAHPHCEKKCSTCYLVQTCCDEVCTTRVVKSVVRLVASWCVPAQTSMPVASGFLFGGLYSPGKPNPLTKTQACPTHFFPLTLFGDLQVCVSSDLELGGSQAVPFGGFFSCQVGNPLAGLKTGQSPGLLQEVFYQNSHTAYPMKCPAAYSQHQAYLSNGCQIVYCLKAGTLLDQQQTAIRMPPFLPPPASLNSSRRAHHLSVLVDSSGEHVWVKPQSSDHWQKTGISYESLQANNFRQLDPGPSAATVAGIYVGSVVVAAAVALGLTYGFRYYKKGGFRIRQKGILAEEQGTYKGTESPAEPGFA